MVRLLLCNAFLVHCFLALGAIYFWCCVFGVCIVSDIAQACYRSGASTLFYPFIFREKEGREEKRKRGGDGWIHLKPQASSQFFNQSTCTHIIFSCKIFADHICQIFADHIYQIFADHICQIFADHICQIFADHICQIFAGYIRLFFIFSGWNRWQTVSQEEMADCTRGRCVRYLNPLLR